MYSQLFSNIKEVVQVNERMHLRTALEIKWRSHFIFNIKIIFEAIQSTLHKGNDSLVVRVLKMQR